MITKLSGGEPLDPARQPHSRGPGCRADQDLGGQSEPQAGCRTAPCALPLAAPLTQPVAGHKNKTLDGDAARAIAQTRQYLRDAEELLRENSTAPGFFNAMIERYPNRLGRDAVWNTARALYGE